MALVKASALKGSRGPTDPEDVAHAEANKTYSFIKGVMYPKAGSEALPPASAYDPISSPLTVKSSMNMNTGTQTFPVGSQKILNTQGAIIWLPRLGYNAIAHGAFMDAQVDTAAVTSADGNSIAALNYGSQIWLPYSEQSANTVIRQEPPPEASFNKIRPFNMYYDFRSVTQPATDVVLNGRSTSVVVSDTTDVCQVKGQAFPNSSLITAARQEKDVEENIPLQDGIVNIQGDDIGADFTDPNEFAVSIQKGSYGLIDSFTFVGNSGTTSYVTPNLYGDKFLCAQRWISPWDIQAQTWGTHSLAVPGATATDTLRAYTGPSWTLARANVRTNPIGEFDRLDFKGYIQLSALVTNSTGPVNVPATIGVDIVAKHYFCGIIDASTGTAGYRHTTQKVGRSYVSYPTPVSQSTYGESDYTPISFEFVSDTASLGPPALATANPNNALTANGKYVGTVIEVWVDYTPLIAYSAAATISLAVFINDAKIYAKPHGGAAEGHRGPAHITTYTGLSQNQELVLDGCANMEAVSKPSLNQLVKSGLTQFNSPASEEPLHLLHALFSAEDCTMFKCVWARSTYWGVYRQVMATTYTQFAQTLLDMYGPDHKAVRAAQTAGLMHDTVANIVPSITQDKDDDRVQELPDVSARGQFGSYSRGQFGAYTSSEGQFGAYPRMRARNDAGGNFLSSLLGGVAKGAAIGSHLAGLF